MVGDAIEKRGGHLGVVEDVRNPQHAARKGLTEARARSLPSQNRIILHYGRQPQKASTFDGPGGCLLLTNRARAWTEVQPTTRQPEIVSPAADTAALKAVIDAIRTALSTIGLTS